MNCCVQGWQAGAAKTTPDWLSLSLPAKQSPEPVHSGSSQGWQCTVQYLFLLLKASAAQWLSKGGSAQCSDYFSCTEPVQYSVSFSCSRNHPVPSQWLPEELALRI